MKPSKPHRFQKNLLATLIAASLVPQAVWSLDLAQSPPGSAEPYVAPNVILSLDDSGSMSYIMTADREPTKGSNEISRATILKQAVLDVFNDTTLLPDGKIRLSWQTMNNCTSVTVGKGTEKWGTKLNNAASTDKNVMRPLIGDHRANFLTYMTNYMKDSPRNCGGTPTHDMTESADKYMRQTLSPTGPWASVNPNTNATEYLACRRNYHILLTDGGWNGTVRSTDPANFDGTRRTFPDGTAYADTAQTRAYWDSESGTSIADWAFKSWADQLQNPNDRKFSGKMAPNAEYQKAEEFETFVRPAGQYRRIDGGGNITLPAKSIQLEKYWNPRNNPASWPHMVTFTIGFSTDALPTRNYTSAGKDPGGNNNYAVFPTSLQPFGYDGNFVDYADGTYRFKAASDKGHDMWHAALNSRGSFYAVEKGEDLKNAFREIVKTINTTTEPELGSTAASGSSASRNDVELFTARYEPEYKWRGFITGQLIKSDGTTQSDGKLFGIPGWAGKDTSQRLDDLTSHTSRVIMSWGDTANAGVPFRWASDESRLSTAQKTALNRKNTGSDIADGLGEARLEYIRGERSREGTDSPANYTSPKVFRERKSRQGDIINSNIWYTGKPVSNYPIEGYADFTRSKDTRQPMIYVGGNDGMLHGFSTKDGSEKLAYVPRGVIPSLPWLTLTNYNQNHRYFVDGSPMTGDIKVSSGATASSWRTMLVGTLGAGGKGYFVLDVTNPSAFSEASASTLVMLDKTRHVSETHADCSTLTNTTAKNACLETEDRDLGHVFASPVLDEVNPKRSSQITRMNDNRWAVVMGNGYNSKNERPVLMIQYLDGDKELKRLVATGRTEPRSDANTTDNGLSAPRLVDINSDGRPDVVYAGDLKGNLWKFDLTSSSASNWNVAFDGAPLFTARGPAAPTDSVTARTLVQPISAPPSVRANSRKKTVTSGNNTTTVNVGGMMVAFGTGLNLDKADPEIMNVQTAYSVLDNTRYKKVGERVQICTRINNDTNVKDEDAAAGACTLSRDDLPQTVSSNSSPNIDQLARQSVSTRHTGTGYTDGFERTFWELTGSAVNWNNQKGWYMDLPLTGERLLKPMEFFDGSNILSVYSQVPARGAARGSQIVGESCETTGVLEETQYLSLLNIMDGLRPSVPVMDLNGDKLYNASDRFVARMTVSKGAQTQITKGREVLNRGGKEREDKLKRLPENSSRPSWRQLR